MHRFATTTKISAQAVPCNNLETRYNGKHTLISDDLYLHIFQVHIKISKIMVTMTMAMLVSIIMLCLYVHPSGMVVERVLRCDVVV